MPGCEMQDGLVGNVKRPQSFWRHGAAKSVRARVPSALRSVIVVVTLYHFARMEDRNYDESADSANLV
jgi:hypothetical protein